MQKSLVLTYINVNIFSKRLIFSFPIPLPWSCRGVCYNAFLWRCTNWRMMNNTTLTSLLSSRRSCDTFIHCKGQKDGRFARRPSEVSLSKRLNPRQFFLQLTRAADLTVAERKDDFLLRKSTRLSQLSLETPLTIRTRTQLSVCSHCCPPREVTVLQDKVCP